MEWDVQKADLPVSCPGCGWEGVLGATDDIDVLGADFELLRKSCACPKCGSEVVNSR